MSPDWIFYDGHCGLCHGVVRFAARADRDGQAFRFAPLGGETFRARLPDVLHAGLPDSFVVWTADGRLLTRSRAVTHMLRRLGGAWRIAAAAVDLLPTSLSDWVYDGVARVRHRLFGRTQAVCPVLPPDLRARFDP